MPVGKLKKGQVWGNSVYRRTILRMWDGMVAFADGRPIDNYPVTEKAFRRWATASGSRLRGELANDQMAKITMDTIDLAEDGYWFITRLQLGMRAALKHLEKGDLAQARRVLERQLEKLEDRHVAKVTVEEAHA